MLKSERSISIQIIRTSNHNTWADSAAAAEFDERVICSWINYGSGCVDDVTYTVATAAAAIAAASFDASPCSGFDYGSPLFAGLIPLKIVSIFSIGNRSLCFLLLYDEQILLAF